MRPQQQNRRMRGRNNGGGNNRKGPNPLNRNYESNGPDVKIRGSAQQIAEKYAALARDAMSSGDRVMAENYLQHAEHYNRIIAAAQAQMPIQQIQHRNDDFDDDLDDDRDEFEGVGAENQTPIVNHGAGPQPVIEGTPAEIALNADDGHNNNRNNNNNGNGRRREDRRPGGNYGQSSGRSFHEEQNSADAPVESAPAEGELLAEAAEVSVPPAQQNLSPADLAAQVARNESGEEAAEPRRARRPRRPRAKPEQNEAASSETGEG